MWLTQAILENDESRTFATEVCGYGDLDALFIEWTDAQKAQWEEEHKSEEDVENV